CFQREHATEGRNRRRVPSQQPSKFARMPVARASLGTSRSPMNRLADSVIGPAAADVSRHELGDLCISRTWHLCQQRRRSHDLAALTVSALRNIFGDPCFLQRMQSVRAEAFYGSDLLAFDLRNWREARTRERAIHMNAASAAKSSSTTKFCS